MQGSLKLIVGLGNPGPQYQNNRHNAGVWFLQQLCARYNGELRPESKFFGALARVTIAGEDVRLLVPTTFKNRSGQSVSAVCKYFDIEPQNMLVAYDEIDLALVAEAETTTLEQDGSLADISYDVIVDALLKWGDKFPRSEAMLVTHSKVYGDIVKSAEIKEASYFGGSTMQTARVPVIAGLPVYVSDNVTLDTGVYTNLIVRRDALRFGMRQDVEMEIKTEKGNTMRYLDADFRYVVDLEQSAQYGAIKVLTT